MMVTCLAGCAGRPIMPSGERLPGTARVQVVRTVIAPAVGPHGRTMSAEYEHRVIKLLGGVVSADPRVDAWSLVVTIEELRTCAPTSASGDAYSFARARLFHRDELAAALEVRASRACKGVGGRASAEALGTVLASRVAEWIARFRGASQDGHQLTSPP